MESTVVTAALLTVSKNLFVGMHLDGNELI